jgi:CBS domain containing-hemolysin-like protein
MTLINSDEQKLGVNNTTIKEDEAKIIQGVFEIADTTVESLIKDE